MRKTPVFLSVLSVSLMLLAPVATFATPTPAQITSQGTLPFTQSPNVGSKLVFAHYFTPYALSFDNKLPAALGGAGDYYDTGYLSPSGEGGVHSAYGGLLRDRPLPRSPLTGLTANDFWTPDLNTEIREAKASGLDGFTVDLLGLYSTSDRNSQQVQRLMGQADAIEGFKIVLMPDISALKSQNPVSVADTVARYASEHPTSAYHLSDGRLVVSPFFAENWPVSSWRAFFNQLYTHVDPRTGKAFKVAFVPCFLNFQANVNAFNALPETYGFSNWGNRSPGANSPVSLTSLAQTSHSLGKLWMQAVSVQDERPNQGVYDEAGNTSNLRLTWQAAIQAADWVQVPTWNDYSEGAQLAPSLHHGWVYADVSAFYSQWFHSGVQPAVTSDAVYLTHRTMLHDAVPSYPETKLMVLDKYSSSATDNVEALLFLTKPALVNVSVGGFTTTCDAPSGVSVCVAPLEPGRAAVGVFRAGALVTSVATPEVITPTPYVQDEQYVAAGSLRDGPSDLSLIQFPPKDITPPTSPSVVAKAVGTSVQVSWSPSTDDVDVSSYFVTRVSRGVSKELTATSNTSFIDPTPPSGVNVYSVVASDLSGNLSVPGSVTVSVATTLSTSSVADTFINASAKTAKYGSSVVMGVRSSPALISYLRFKLPTPPPGQVLVKATLSVRTTVRSSSGSVNTFTLWPCLSSWVESRVSYLSHPACSKVILGKLVSPVKVNTIYSVSLSSAALLKARSPSGEVSLAFTGSGKDYLELLTRESSRGKPVLTLIYQ